MLNKRFIFNVIGYPLILLTLIWTSSVAYSSDKNSPIEDIKAENDEDYVYSNEIESNKKDDKDEAKDEKASKSAQDSQVSDVKERTAGLEKIDEIKIRDASIYKIEKTDDSYKVYYETYNFTPDDRYKLLFTYIKQDPKKVHDLIYNGQSPFEINIEKNPPFNKSSHLCINLYDEKSQNVVNQTMKQCVAVPKNSGDTTFAYENYSYPKEETGQYLGAYVFQPVDDRLYIGIGKARPVEYNGAIFSVYDGKDYFEVASLSEQGIHDFAYDPPNKKIYIAGSDPAYSDGWDAGNIYTYDTNQDLPGSIVKHRDHDKGLTDVLHMWGIWVNDNGDVYSAVSAADVKRYKSYCDLGITCWGDIFKSTDGGDVWTDLTGSEPDFDKRPDASAHIGDYRNADIIGFNEKLYSVPWDWSDYPKLSVSNDDGKSWQIIKYDNPDYKTTVPIYTDRYRLIIFNDQLLIASEYEIFSIDKNDNIARHKLPFTLGKDTPYAGNFNLIATENESRYLYVIGSKGQVLRTSDLENWTKIYSGDENFTSLSFWPNKNALVLGTFGENASVYLLDLSELPRIEADFTSNKTLLLNGQTVEFYDKSTNFSNKELSYSWDFGDGSSSTEKDPKHIYTAEKDYTVKLTISDGTYSDTKEKAAYIQVKVPISPNFEASPKDGSFPLEVKFTNKSTIQTDETVIWSWDFDNDGNIDSTEENPVYTYSKKGNYSVKLIGKSASFSGDNLKSNYIKVINPVVVDFSADSTIGKLPLTVKFTDTSTYYQKDGLFSWEWDFNNDSKVDSKEQNPTYIFETQGNFTVSLTVKNEFYQETKAKKDFISVIYDPFVLVSEELFSKQSANSHAASWVDFDNDGDLDLFVANGGIFSAKKNSLYRNMGNGVFEDVIEGEIVNKADSYYSSNWADIDNDGDFDLFSITYSPYGNNLLLMNDGYGSFEKLPDHLLVKVSKNNKQNSPQNASWADYDNDGDLDIFIADDNNWPSTLYNNLGNMNFEPAANANELFNKNRGYSQQGSWADIDNDGDLDLLVVNYYSPHNNLYLNKGNGEFEEVTTGVVVEDRGYSTGASWGDYNNDGRLDLFISIFGDSHDKIFPGFLYKSNGDGSFNKDEQDAISQTKASATGSTWADYDNDGDLDLFIYTKGNIILFKNDSGNFSKVEVGIFSQRVGSNDLISKWGYFGDYDQNGTMDLLLIKNRGLNVLYKNTASGNWLEVKLNGIKSNNNGIGAQIFVKYRVNGSDKQQMRQISSTGAGRGQDSLLAHFGLGTVSKIDELIIKWPSGISQKQLNVPVNRIITINEEEGTFNYDPPGVIPNDDSGEDSNDEDGSSNQNDDDEKKSHCESDEPKSAPKIEVVKAEQNSITVKWSKVSPVTNYNLFFTRMTDNLRYGTANVGHNNQYTISNLVDGTKYKIEVYAINECKEGDTGHIEVRTLEKPVLPSGVDKDQTVEDKKASDEKVNQERPVGSDGKVFGVKKEPESQSKGILGAIKYFGYFLGAVLVASVVTRVLHKRIRSKKAGSKIG